MIRAAVMSKPNTPIQIMSFHPPELEAGEILLKTLYSEVCGTDIHLMDGKLDGVPYPIIPGHFSVGIVEQLNGQKTDVNGVEIHEGSLIAFLDVHGSCNQCWHCLVAKSTTKCPERRVYGVTETAIDGLLGGWSEKIYLKSSVKILALPETVSAKSYIAAGCALPTALHAIERAEIKIGDCVVIQGAGPVGICAAIVARLSGAGEVIIIDRIKSRLEVALGLGVGTAIQFCPEDPHKHIAEILALTRGRGADVTIEAAGVPAAFKQGLALTRDNGRYVVVGHYTDAGSTEINPHHEINRKHLEIRGTWGIDFSHFHKMIGVLENQREMFGVGNGWEDLITGSYSLDQTNQALDDVRHGRVVKAIIQPNI